MEFITPKVCGDQTGLEHSRIGRTYVMKALRLTVYSRYEQLQRANRTIAVSL